MLSETTSIPSTAQFGFAHGSFGRAACVNLRDENQIAIENVAY
jgi:hypothetical protein